MASGYTREVRGLTASTEIHGFGHGAEATGLSVVKDRVNLKKTSAVAVLGRQNDIHPPEIYMF